MKLSVSALLLALASSSTANAATIRNVGGVPKELLLDQLPDSGEHWQSLPNGVELQPASNLSPLAQEHLRRMVDAEDDTSNRRRMNTYFSSSNGGGGDFDTSMSKIYLDGAGTYQSFCVALTDAVGCVWRHVGEDCIIWF